MPASLVLLVAVIVGVVVDISATPLIAAAIAAASSALAVPRWWKPFALISAAFLCAAYGASARDDVVSAPLTSALATVLDDRAAPPVFVSGVLRDDAAVDGDGARLTIDVDHVRLNATAEWRAVAGRAQASIGGATAVASAHAWTRGRRVTLPMLAKRPPIWLNPGSPSERWQRIRRSIDITGSAKSAALVVVTPGRWWSEFGARVRAHVRRTLDSTVGAFSHESAGIVTAILIGDRTGLDDATVRRLQMAGTYHVIAISGGNIAIVVVTCLMLLRSLLRSPRVIAAITLVVVLAYGGLVGDQASVMRAVTAAAVVLTLQIIGWCAPTLRVFFLAALVVALVDPPVVIDVGAWLSFGATLGILLLAAPIASWISQGRGRVMTMTSTLLAATMAAELALAPVSAAVFSRVGVAGLLLNFIAIPAMTVAQLAGTVVVIVSALLPRVAHRCAFAAHAGAFALVWSTKLLQLMPWLSWQTPPVPAFWTALDHAGLAIALASRRWRRAACAMSAASFLVIVVGWNWPSAAPKTGFLRVTMLDVGQGQSIALQFPTGQSLLLDTGGSPSSFDIGARVVEPALWALGVRKLDWLAVTHGDIDHAGGAPSIFRDLKPSEVWEGVPVPRDARMQALRTSVHDQGAVWRRLNTGHVFEVGSVVVEILNPPVPDWERRDNRNDDSLVVRVQFGQVSLLLTGDIERASEAGLPIDPGPSPPRLRLLSAPHHGSRTSSTPALLDRWRPHIVLVSAGRANSFGHPAPEVLARYERLGAEVFRTDRDGAVIIETDGRVVQIETASGRTWRLSYVG